MPGSATGDKRRLVNNLPCGSDDLEQRRVLRAGWGIACDQNVERRSGDPWSGGRQHFHCNNRRVSGQLSTCQTVGPVRTLAPVIAERLDARSLVRNSATRSSLEQARRRAAPLAISIAPHPRGASPGCGSLTPGHTCNFGVPRSSIAQPMVPATNFNADRGLRCLPAAQPQGSSRSGFLDRHAAAPP